MNSLRITWAAIVTVTYLPGYVSAESGIVEEELRGGEIKEIIVTAQRRQERLQDVPLSVSAFDSSTLANMNVTNVSDLKAIVPALSAESSLGVTLPFLRGVGNPSLIVGNEASIPVYVDGVYYVRIAPSLFELNNIERVEVLKGPQGTLFGRNSTGGLVHIITRDPTPEMTMKGSVSYERFDRLRASGYVGGGTAQAAADLAVIYSNQENGWGRNITTGADTYTDENLALRSKLVLKPGDRTELKFAFDYNDSKTGQGLAQHAFRDEQQGDLTNLAVALPELSFYDARGGFPTYAEVESWGASLRIDQQLAFANLVSITAYREIEGMISIDVDFQPTNYYGALEPYESDQTSQEFQLMSGSGSAVDWIAGVYFLRQFNAYTPTRLLGDSFGPGVMLDLFGSQRSKSYAGYAQATLNVGAATRITGGVRYTRDELEGKGHLSVLLDDGTIVDPGTQLQSEAEFDKITWRIAVDHYLTEDVLIFASTSEGYKSGVFNLQPFDGHAVQPEKLRSYEVGVKTEWFDQRLRLNGSAFYYDISDPQVQRDTGTGVSLQNAETARIKGIDLDGEAVLSTDLVLRFGATWLDAEYVSFNDALFYTINPDPPFGNLPDVLVGDASGNRMPRAPKFTYSIGLSYVIPTSLGDFSLDTNYYRTSKQYFNPDNRQVEPAYGLLDAQLSYKLSTSATKISVFGKNLTDKEYFTSALQTAGPVGNVGTPGAPRTVGLKVEFEF
ncbi:hypothetical protein ACG33_10580 [Steroidobacter denitrificans]|uniref:TonB-dependent receptor n=1 Tax=Steroidobacter denitrificans TaxID=465721 RepID=A0A127FD46_STEDE|nr:TonB-dependent receptor [Steroidobacter denitrificans]AMN47535.1 hypothetical protein ACG33_10580 [Steroidobacter denitrificans]